jgi:pimeloyl-ACP methyl ester carboxylesterase
MLKVLAVLLIAAMTAYAMACLGLFVFQRSFIYFPPREAAVSAPKVTTLAAPGAVLKVSERPREGGKAVIYLGGNAEDVSASLPLFERAFPEHALYLLHYRGYAGSTGSPTEKDLVQDALALYDRVATQHPEVVLVGRSLGTGVAVQVASRRPAHRLVLVTPYDSIAGIAVQQFRAFPVRLLLKDTYESGRYAPQVKAPTLILAASNDEVIPAWSTRLLVTRFAPGVASMTMIEGAGHNTISESSAYLAALASAR